MKIERVLIAFAILVALSGCQCGKNRSIPNDLVGVWKTSAPKYADRFFEIEKNTITFGTGEGNFEIYAITNIEVEKVREEKSTLYTICYENEEEQKYKFAFYHYSEKKGMIRLKHQNQIVWTKEKG